MMIALFMAYNMMDLLDPNAEVTITKRSASGELEMITRKGSELKVQKVTDKALSGQGSRLGVAYQLQNGQTVYVPD